MFRKWGPKLGPLLPALLPCLPPPPRAALPSCLPLFCLYPMEASDSMDGKTTAPPDLESSSNPVFEDESTLAGQPACGFNKGDASNLATFLIMAVGIIMKTQHPRMLGVDCVLSAGLFGFAGGVTNWLAVKMLFDRVPLLVGSGVIPRQFKEIRAALKAMVMQMFFDRSFIESFIAERAKDVLGNTLDISGGVKAALAGPDVDATMERTLTKISETEDGKMLKSVGAMVGGMAGLVPKLKPVVEGFAVEVGELLASNLDPAKLISVDKVLVEVDRLLEEKVGVCASQSAGRVRTNPQRQLSREGRR